MKCPKCGNDNSQIINQASILNIKKVLQQAKCLNTDLIEVSAHKCSCEYCSKFQGRIFSISGKNKHYPQIPIEVLQNGSFHDGCRHTFFPHIEGTSKVYNDKELDNLNKTAIK